MRATGQRRWQLTYQDGRCGPGADMRIRTSRGSPRKIMKVSQDGDTQYAERAGRTVLLTSREAIKAAREERKEGQHSLCGVTLSF
ncbi:hypothetical protein DPMN_156558 [Dreissena polymorpha]|nr:hypothetical protein DPMN_156558 [Dreissena polymorpha]